MPDPLVKLRGLTRTLWAMVAFLMGFAVLLVVVSRHYLIPAFAAASDADSTGRKQLAAVSALLLAILLIIIVVGLLLVFRARRAFIHRHMSQRRPTTYTDAWTESAHRLKTPKATDAEET